MSVNYTQQEILNLLQKTSYDKLNDYAVKNMAYTGAYAEDKFRESIAKPIADFMNTNYVSKKLTRKLTNPKTFFERLTKLTDDYKQGAVNYYNKQLNNGHLKYLKKDDIIQRNLLVKAYNEARNINKDNLYRVEDNTYITKDKNVFIDNFDTITAKIPAIANQYQTIKAGIDLSKVTTIDINPAVKETEITIKALVDKIREALADGSLNVTQNYTYKLLIQGGWKMYPIHSRQDWNTLLDMLETSSLVLNLDNLSQLFASNEFYNPNDITLPELSIIQQIEIAPGQHRNLRGDNASEFFQYVIKEQYAMLEPVLSKAQIFVTIADGNTHRQEFNYNCLCYALLQASLKESNLRVNKEEWDLTFNQICRDCTGRNVSIKEVKFLVEKYNLFINLTTFAKTDKKRNRKRDNMGNKDKAIITCELGIFKQKNNVNHFFYNCKVPASRYFSKNIDKVLEYSEKHNKPIEWSYKVTKFARNCFQTDKTKYCPLNMIDFIYLLFDSNVFTPLSYEDTADLKSDLHHYNKGVIDSLEYHEANVKNIKYKEPIDDEKEHRYFYADFEADPTADIHVPYCCSVCEREEINKTQTFYGLDCVEQLLAYLPEHSITYFHNLGYDGRFIAKYGVKSAINKSSKIMTMNVKYQDKALKFKDSYTMLAKPLKDFPTMFKNVIDNSKIHKELFPYNYYTINNVKNNVGIISEAGEEERPKWNKDQYKTFNENINKIDKCRIDDNHFNMEKYCKFYCEQDVKILALGHTEFNRLSLEQPIEMDIDKYISAPALANAFFTKNVYSKIPNLRQYSGIVREFIQKGVYGGRCMTRDNKKYHIDESLSDFDACSLYASSMFRLFLPTGEPHICTQEMLEGSYLIEHVLKENELKPTNDKPLSAFFIEINITKVGKNRHFPLICKRTKQGNSNVNECCTMFVDNFFLEDLVKYQEIEYEAIRGYYWTGSKSPILSKVIRQLYDLRVKYKKEGNPIQEVLKLIMNSAYGKTIQKPINNDIVYRRSWKDKHGSSESDRYLDKNFHKIQEAFNVGDKITAFKIISSIDKHYVPNFVGVQILSMSKRIMNEVMCTAEDLEIPIYYQDTDSMHIEVNELETLAKEYEKRFNRKLIGSDMGQFHSDFDHKDGGKNIISIESYFLGKKAYCDQLENENKQIDYHLRMKGIPNDSLKKYAKDNFNDEPLEMYKYLFDGNIINFNILEVQEGSQIHLFFLKSIYLLQKYFFTNSLVICCYF